MKENTDKQVANTGTINPTPAINGGIFSNHSTLLHRPISSFEDLYGLETTFSDGCCLESFPHFVTDDASKIKVISYDDLDQMGQAEIIERMGDRRLLISLKHHAIKPDSDPKEKIKLQSTHAQLVVRSGHKVCTYNNPQNYQNGMFGSPTYPMIFLEPVFPSSVAPTDIVEYEKNIILWATLLNTFSEFPGDYNGGDPLSAKTEVEALEYGNQVLKALSGDQDAIEWVKHPSKHLYCAELVYLSLTLGVIYPLTSQSLSQESFDVLQKEVVAKDFLQNNSNQFIKEIELEMPRDGLPALVDSNCLEETFFNSSLAVTPMLFSDMITSFIKYTINRAKLGETAGSYQFELLKMVRPMIASMMPGALSSEVEQLLDQLEIVLKTTHGNYQEFKGKLAPLLGLINESVAKVSTSSDTFIPPHTFLVRSLEFEREGKIKGILGMKYFAHGVHKSLI